MTLGRFSALLTVVLVAVPFYAAFSTGQVMLLWVLAAPLPTLVVYGFLRDYEDWTPGHLLDHLRDEDPIEADLDAALRPPAPTVPPPDGSYFVPGCPDLGAEDTPEDVTFTAP